MIVIFIHFNHLSTDRLPAKHWSSTSWPPSKKSIFRIQLFSDTVTFRSYGLCQRAGRVGVDPPDKFRRKSWGGWENSWGGFNPPNPPTTKSLLFTEMHDMCVSGGASELKDVHLWCFICFKCLDGEMGCVNDMLIDLPYFYSTIRRLPVQFAIKQRCCCCGCCCCC